MKFRFISFSMRKQLLSKSKNRSTRIRKDISEPCILKPLRNITVVNKVRQVGHLHVRSRTRLFDQDMKDKLYGYSQTPASFLPKIYQNTLANQENNDKNEMDSLQTYIHTLLLKNLKKYKLHKEVKTVEEQLGKKKQNIMQKQEETKKQKEKTKLQQLRLKLNELYGELSVQQNHLKIQYEVQAKMQNKYNNYYDKIAKRFKNNTVDTAQNTQQIAITNNNTDKPKPKCKSKFRVVALAVYFAILFPKYCKVFHVVRRKDHFQKVIKSNGLKKSIDQCHKLFELMKLKVFWIQLQYKNKLLPYENITISIRRKAQQDSFTFKIENINGLLKYLLSSIISAIKNGQIDELIKAIALVFLNRSFLTPHIFLQQQLFHLHLNQNGTIDVCPQAQRKLMLNFVLTKLTGFGFMINHRFTNNTNKYIVNSQNNKFENLSQTISQQLLVSGLYLMQLCNRISKQKNKQLVKQGNIELVKDEKRNELVLPMDQLESKEEIIIKNNASAQKRSSIQSYLHEKQYIQTKKVTNLLDLIGAFEENPAEGDLIKLVMQVQEQIYKKSIVFKRQFYQSYKDQALKQLKMPSDKEIYVPLKSEEQKQKISKYCNMFRQRRGKDNKEGQIKEQIHLESQISQKALEHQSSAASQQRVGIIEEDSINIPNKQ